MTRVSLSAGNYRTQLYDKQREEYLPATQGLGMFVEVKDPDDKVNRQAKEGRPQTRAAEASAGLNWFVFSVFPAGDSVSAVRLRGKIHLHVTHTWRTSDLSALQLLQVLPVRRRHAGEETLHTTAVT